MKLTPTSLAAWKYNQREEAARLGYNVAFVFTPSEDKLVALFFNGEFFCYSRTFAPPPQEPNT
jgi:hypothetical protein